MFGWGRAPAQVPQRHARDSRREIAGPNRQADGRELGAKARQQPVEEGEAQGAASKPSGPGPLVLQSVDDLIGLRLGFEQKLDKEILVGTHLTYQICPVLLGGPIGSSAAQAAVMCSAEASVSDEALAIRDQLARDTSRWTLWRESPIIVASETLLLSVVRGQVTKEQIGKRRQIRATPGINAAYGSLKEVVRWGLEQGASDITFTMHDGQPLSQISFMINGLDVAPERFRIPTGTLNSVLNTAYMIAEGVKVPVYDPTIEQDARVNLNVDGQDILLRWASIASQYPGPSVTTRIVKMSQVEHLRLDELGYLPTHIAALNRAINAEGGAVILVGVVNSGKTHTIAAMMGGLPQSGKKMSLESPVELLIPGVIQKTVNGDYTEELKIIKRSAMHHVLLGEIRDVADGRAFSDLAAMGVNLYTTTHAPDALGAYDKLTQDTVQVSRDFLATPRMVKVIVGQALLPSNCPSCRLPFTSVLRDGAPRASDYLGYAKRLERLYGIDIDAIRIQNPDGCPDCRRSELEELYGLAGRKMVAEVFEPDEYALKLVKAADVVGLKRYFSEHRTSDYSSSDMTGKTSMECAVYWMTQGVLDPRRVEPRFHTFEREEMLRKSRDRLAAAG
jgi:type II secretory ATPase GspE/PulE/Tfp pilus assembly ATPase PilB-like protein